MKRHLAGLALLIVAVAWLNAAWVAADLQPPMDDDNTHIITAIQSSRAVTEAQTLDQRARALLMWNYMYPPAAYYPATLLFTVEAPSVDGAIASLSVFVALLVAACFFAGWRAGGPLAAWLCALGAATCPLALYFSRVYFVDMPQTAFVAASFAALCWSDRLQRKVPTVLAGLFAGGAMMVKPASFPLLVAPVAVLVVGALRGRQAKVPEIAVAAAAVLAATITAYEVAAHIALRSDANAWVAEIVLITLTLATLMALVAELLWHRHRATAGGLCAYAAAAFLVSGSWYMGNLRAAWEKWRVQDRAWEYGNFTPLDAALYTLRDLGGMLWLAGPLMLIGVAIAIRRKRMPDDLAASLLAMLLLVVWCAKSGWADRYVLIALPFVAVAAVWWIPTVRRGVLIAAVVAVGWAWQSLGGWLMDRGVATAMPLFSRAGSHWSAVPRAAPPPLREPFPLDELMDMMAKGDGKTVRVLNDHDRGLQTRTLVLYEMMAPRGLQFITDDRPPEGGGYVHPETLTPPPGRSPEEAPTAAFVLMANYDPNLLDLWQLQLVRDHPEAKLLAERAFPRALKVRVFRMPPQPTARQERP